MAIVILSALLLFASQTYGNHEFRIINNCKQPLNIGTRGDNGNPSDGGFTLNAGQTKTLQIQKGWISGRIWARTGCKSNNCCDTGDCGCKLQCNGAAGTGTVSLAEFTLDSNTGGLDFYDISLVDAFNLPMSIKPFNVDNANSKTCKELRCIHDFLKDCPKELRKVVNGKTVACLNACEALRKPEFCCTKPFDTPEKCKPNKYSQYFRQKCPDAYSYAYDDKKSTYTCKSAEGRSSGYTITFCPQ